MSASSDSVFDLSDPEAGMEEFGNGDINYMEMEEFSHQDIDYEGMEEFSHRDIECVSSIDKYKYKGIVNKTQQKTTSTKGPGRPQGTVKSKGRGKRKRKNW